MLDILYLAPGLFDKGGVSRYCRFQVRALRELLGPTSISVLSLLPPGEDALEEVFAVDFASFGPSPSGKALFSAAAAVVAGRRPRIVWAAHLGIAPLGLALSRIAAAKSVLNIYGAEVWTDVGPLRAAALRGVDHLVSDCHNTLRYVTDHDLRGNGKAHVHWDCVDLSRFSPGDPGDVLSRYGARSNGDFKILTLGRMGQGTEYKGYDRLLELMASLRSEPVRLVLAGDGSRRAVLQARAVELGVADRVDFLGSVHENDMPAIYRACDLFSLVTNVVPGGGEGIPLTPLEAAACGKPILVGNEDGSREAAEDGVSGFVLDPFDLEAMRQKVLLLLRDVGTRIRMGQLARARVEREHSYERFRGRVELLLKELL